MFLSDWGCELPDFAISAEEVAWHYCPFDSNGVIRQHLVFDSLATG